MRAAARSNQRGNSGEKLHHVGSYDFLVDRAEDGRRLNLLVVIDELTGNASRMKCGGPSRPGVACWVLTRDVQRHSKTFSSSSLSRFIVGCTFTAWPRSAASIAALVSLAR